MGLIAVKILAPGFYARQDIRTPVRIAVVVLVLTQVLNAALVPALGVAGLALSIGLGALVNALWLLIGLRRQGRYQPLPGWWGFVWRVLLACTALAALLLALTQQLDWVGLKAAPWLRLLWMGGALLLSALVYFGALWLLRLPLRALLRR